mgnify:CR=1 FL=1
MNGTNFIDTSRNLSNIGTYSGSGNITASGASSPTLTLQDTTNNVYFKAYAQDSNAFVGTTSSHNLNIGTNNTTAINLDNSQNVSIQTQLEMNGTAVINSSRYLGNIARFYFQNNFSGTYLEAQGDYLEVNSTYGYTRIGPGNASYSHFYTDRPAYYFNKKLQVDEGIVQSHNEDLQLRRTNSSNDRINIGDTVIQFFLDGSEDMRLTNTGNLDVEGDVTAFSTVVASDEIGRAHV